ncbi:hypothetical protein DFH07DRAFT_968556 [Mycena maculata]|uniref:NmrA-like domain-containing protein n=1 Tax=Mycena maculata TaxID=230809 RepID=A0AAD7I096_9AGAR|nr:hypothetical protein DFH07DRAFT_968556 [Mycena maculata]
MSSRIVSVFGATGLQGSSVLEVLLKDSTFTPRAITRNPESEAALKLKERGVEVVQGDSGDKASLVRALHGSEAVFAVTVPVMSGALFEDAGPSELTQGKNMVDASKEAGVKFFVFSTLPGVNKLAGGKYTKVHPFDDKEEIEQYLKASGLANASIMTAAFLENFWVYQNLKKTATGFDISFPYSPISLQSFTWVQHDLGEAALALLKGYTDPANSVSGKVYKLIIATMTYPDLAAMFSKELGVEVTFTRAATSGIPTLDEMFAAQVEHNGFHKSAPIPNPALIALGSKVGTIEQFMETEVKKHFKALLKDGTFTPRAITRNPESEAALKLKERGVEAVKGDSGDKASLVTALKGSEAVFAVTVPLMPPINTSGPSELTQGKNMVDASKEAGVKFVVFRQRCSSLPSVKKISGGKYTKASPFDDKEEIEQYLKASGLANASIITAGFLENLWVYQNLKKTATGFDISIAYSPTSLQSFTWVQHDLGEAALTLLKAYIDPAKDVSGKVYPLVIATMTFPALAAKIANALGVNVTFTSAAASGIPMLDETYAVLSEYNGFHTTTPIPNPDLVALGAKFGTIEQFMETEVKRHFT